MTPQGAAQPTRGFKEAKRAQLSLLAPAEKRLLVWLAGRMPQWVNSDHLTALGFVSLIAAGLAYAAASRDVRWLHLVNVCLVANWFGDSLDGTLARVRNRLRPRYGFYVDHIIDAVGTLVLIGGMGFSSVMSPGVAVGLIIAYFLLSIEVYLATHTMGTFELSFAGMSPTELRVLLLLGNVTLLLRPATVPLFGRDYRLFDVGGAVGIVLMGLIFLHKTVTHTVRLYREERLP